MAWAERVGMGGIGGIGSDRVGFGPDRVRSGEIG